MLTFALSSLALAAHAGSALQDPAADAVHFRDVVEPVLAKHCYECHGAEGRPKGGLRLDSRAAFLAGGDSGPVQEGDGPFDASLLLEALGYEDELLQMPPSAKLPEADLAVLVAWIGRGAPYGSDPGAPPPEEHVEHVEPRITRGDGFTGWAYAPVSQAVPPEVPGSEHPIDRFVRARLAEEGLAPNPRADERTLVRRLHYDLLGLPPTPDVVEAYVRDTDPDKWAKLIDQLLGSPHYGERWGRHWLDVVRYAETNGFERDSNKPNIWRYRDWVVGAFNSDLPYDRFVLEQLAGDELPDRDHGSITASGYLRLAQWDDEPGAGALQGRYDVLDDIVSTTGQVFLGSTIGCARCHDHKADPFDARHYYEWMAFFHGLTDMSTAGTQVDIATPEEAAVADTLEAERLAEVASLEAERRTFTTALLAALETREGAAAAGPGPFEGLAYRFYRDTWAALPDFEMFRPEDSGALASGYLDLAPRTRDHAIGFVQEGRLGLDRAGTYELRVHADDGARVLVDGAEVVRLDGLGDAPRKALGTAALGAGTHDVRVEWFNAAGPPVLAVDLRRIEDQLWRFTTEPPQGDAWTKADFDDSAWTEAPGGFGSLGTPGADVGTPWTSGDIWLRRTFHWEPGRDADPCFVLHHDEDVEVHVNGVRALRRGGFTVSYVLDELSAEGRAALREGENVLAVHCRQTAGGQYVDVALVPRAATLSGLELRDVALGRRALSAPTGARDDEALERLALERADELLGAGSAQRYNELRERLRHARERRTPRVTAFAARERGGEPPPLAVHVRGNANALGKPVQPAIPAFLAAAPLPEIVPAPDGSSSGRRTAFARWVTSPQNPLTARVMVNRVWQHHFGRGIVATANDFGELGDRPSHRELLDWLAREFVANGWSVKALHRTILMSETWRQSSAGSEGALAVDAANTLLWRMSPRRAGAEEVRDTMLAVAGVLELALGGPSVYGPMPAAALATSSTPHSVWGESSEQERNRRTLYIKVKRSLLTPFLVAHDMADVDASCPVRFTTIIPTQALQMINGEFPNDVARRFADRLERELPERASGASGGVLAGRVRRALELALQEPPSDPEVAEYVEFVRALEREDGLAPRRALELFCLTVINLNQFVFID